MNQNTVPSQETTLMSIDQPFRTRHEPVNVKTAAITRDSLSEIFNREIDAWAAHALHSNGFGD